MNTQESSNPRRRLLAKARIQVFDEIIQNVTHEEEIKALSPSLFKSTTPGKTPLPEAVNALPDAPRHLEP